MLRLYRNGVELDTMPCHAVASQPAYKSLGIGTWLDEFGARSKCPAYWDGRIDEVAIFNHAEPGASTELYTGSTTVEPPAVKARRENRPKVAETSGEEKGAPTSIISSVSVSRLCSTMSWMEGSGRFGGCFPGLFPGAPTAATHFSFRRVTVNKLVFASCLLVCVGLASVGSQLLADTVVLQPAAVTWSGLLSTNTSWNYTINNSGLSSPVGTGFAWSLAHSQSRRRDERRCFL